MVNPGWACKRGSGRRGVPAMVVGLASNLAANAGSAPGNDTRTSSGTSMILPVSSWIVP
jgi:hypothetical protein